MLEVDASRVLGMPQVAGTWVNRKGSAKKMVASTAGNVAGGVAGGLAGSAAAGGLRAGPPETPDIGMAGAFLAVGESAIALVPAKRGLLKPKIGDEAMANAQKAEVASAELGDGKLACPLTITFTNGVTWEFDVPRGGKSAAQGVVDALGGTTG